MAANSVMAGATRRRHCGTTFVFGRVVASVLILCSSGMFFSSVTAQPVVSPPHIIVHVPPSQEQDAAEEKTTLRVNTHALLRVHMSLACENSTDSSPLDKPVELNMDEKWFLRVEELSKSTKEPPSLLYLEQPVVFGWFNQEDYRGFNATVSFLIPYEEEAVEAERTMVVALKERRSSDDKRGKTVIRRFANVPATRGRSSGIVVADLPGTLSCFGPKDVQDEKDSRFGKARLSSFVLLVLFILYRRHRKKNSAPRQQNQEHPVVHVVHQEANPSPGTIGSRVIIIMDDSSDDESSKDDHSATEHHNGTPGALARHLNDDDSSTDEQQDGIDGPPDVVRRVLDPRAFNLIPDNPTWSSSSVVSHHAMPPPPPVRHMQPNGSMNRWEPAFPPSHHMDPTNVPYPSRHHMMQGPPNVELQRSHHMVPGPPTVAALPPSHYTEQVPMHVPFPVGHYMAQGHPGHRHLVSAPANAGVPEHYSMYESRNVGASAPRHQVVQESSNVGESRNVPLPPERHMVSEPTTNVEVPGQYRMPESMSARQVVQEPATNVGDPSRLAPNHYMLHETANASLALPPPSHHMMPGSTNARAPMHWPTHYRMPLQESTNTVANRAAENNVRCGQPKAPPAENESNNAQSSLEEHTLPGMKSVGHNPVASALEPAAAMPKYQGTAPQAPVQDTSRPSTVPFVPPRLTEQVADTSRDRGDAVAAGKQCASESHRQDQGEGRTPVPCDYAKQQETDGMSDEVDAAGRDSAMDHGVAASEGQASENSRLDKDIDQLGTVLGNDGAVIQSTKAVVTVEHGDTASGKVCAAQQGGTLDSYASRDLDATVESGTHQESTVEATVPVALKTESQGDQTLAEVERADDAVECIEIVENSGNDSMAPVKRAPDEPTAVTLSPPLAFKPRHFPANCSVQVAATTVGLASVDAATSFGNGAVRQVGTTGLVASVNMDSTDESGVNQQAATADGIAPGVESNALVENGTVEESAVAEAMGASESGFKEVQDDERTTNVCSEAVTDKEEGHVDKNAKDTSTDVVGAQKTDNDAIAQENEPTGEQPAINVHHEVATKICSKQSSAARGKQAKQQGSTSTIEAITKRKTSGRGSDTMDRAPVQESNWLQRLRNRPGRQVASSSVAVQQPTGDTTGESQGRSDSSICGDSGKLSYVSTLSADSSQRSSLDNGGSSNACNEFAFPPNASAAPRTTERTKTKRRLDVFKSRFDAGEESKDRNSQADGRKSAPSAVTIGREASKQAGSSHAAAESKPVASGSKSAQDAKQRPKKPPAAAKAPPLPDVVPSARLQAFSERIQAPVWQYDQSLSSKPTRRKRKRQQQRGTSRGGIPREIILIDNDGDSPKEQKGPGKASASVSSQQKVPSKRRRVTC